MSNKISILGVRHLHGDQPGRQEQGVRPGAQEVPPRTNRKGQWPVNYNLKELS